MRLARDISGAELVKRLERLGYRTTRQTGSQVLITSDKPQPQHVTVPNHNPLRIGTLAAIIGDVAAHHRLNRDELIRTLFG